MMLLMLAGLSGAVFVLAQTASGTTGATSAPDYTVNGIVAACVLALAGSIPVMLRTFGKGDKKLDKARADYIASLEADKTTAAEREREDQVHWNHLNDQLTSTVERYEKVISRKDRVIEELRDREALNLRRITDLELENQRLRQELRK